MVHGSYIYLFITILYFLAGATRGCLSTTMAESLVLVNVCLFSRSEPFFIGAFSVFYNMLRSSVDQVMTSFKLWS
uniref:Uncharacterized protein n=1 Tax=Mus spicilegus TaxID=10103 RepID=A0A8C6HI04_MUSSI